MKTFMIAGAAAFMLIAPAAHARGAAETAAQVRAADVAWSHLAQTKGVAEAFRETIDPTDGLQFGGAGAPTHGAEAVFKAMGGATPTKERLEWKVVDAWGSASGDMGVTTGTFRAWTADSSTPPVTGRYVTVWRKDAHGAWKALIDIGNPDPK